MSKHVLESCVLAGSGSTQLHPMLYVLCVISASDASWGFRVQSRLCCGVQAADQELAAARQQHQQAETRETALAVDLRALNAELSSTKVMLMPPQTIVAPHLHSASSGVAQLVPLATRHAQAAVLRKVSASRHVICSQTQSPPVWTHVRSRFLRVLICLMQNSVPPQENASQLTKECAEHKRKAADEADELERERVKRRRLDDDNKVNRRGQHGIMCEAKPE